MRVDSWIRQVNDRTRVYFCIEEIICSHGHAGQAVKQLTLYYISRYTGCFIRLSEGSQLYRSLPYFLPFALFVSVPQHLLPRCPPASHDSIMSNMFTTFVPYVARRLPALQQNNSTTRRSNMVRKNVHCMFYKRTPYERVP